MPESPATGAPCGADLLAVHCTDHLASATGGVELVSRIGQHRGSRHEAPLEQLLDELREERTALRTTLVALGLPVRGYEQLLTWAAEKLSRGKLNGRPVTRSPLSDLVEFEFVAAAVLAERGWSETLRAHTGDSRPPAPAGPGSRRKPAVMTAIPDRPG